MNATSFSYPKFHDSYHVAPGAKSQKEMDIDASVYQLLSLYLNKDALANNTTLLSSQRPSRQSAKNYSRQTYGRAFQSPKSWLGEDSRNERDKIVERNTIRNASIQVTQLPRITLSKKKRTKTVSFSNTVTVVVSPNNVSITKLDKEDDDEEEECFVDALEYIS